MPSAPATRNELQSSGMLSREQLLHLFSRFSFLTSQPDVKKRIVDAVRDKQFKVYHIRFLPVYSDHSDHSDHSQHSQHSQQSDHSDQSEQSEHSGHQYSQVSTFQHPRPTQNIGQQINADQYSDYLMQEAVAITTAIQDEIFLEMGIDPRFGIACLGKVNAVYENDMDLMIQFYRFITNEEIAIDEAELEPDEFADKMDQQQRLQELQLEMLKNMRRFHSDDQSRILEKIHEQMAGANFANNAVLLTSDQIQEIVSQRAPISRT